MAQILLIDDDPDVWEIITLRLRSLGHDVVVARDGAQAMLVLPKVSVDLIILDLMMPTMDGFAFLAQRSKAPGARAPVLVLTAADSSAMERSALEAGADDYLAKPVEVGDLVHKVQKLLRESIPGTAEKVSVAIYDTDDDSRRNLSAHLIAAGYSVKPAERSSDIIRLAEIEKPGMFVINIGALETTGYHVCQRIKQNERLKDVPLIALAEESAMRSPELAQVAGADDVVRKPIDWPDLKAKMEGLLKRG